MHFQAKSTFGALPRLLLLTACLLWPGGWAWGQGDGGQLHLRMVLASRQAGAEDGRVADLVAFLREASPFTQFNLLGEARLPATGGTAKLPRDFAVECTPVAEGALKVVIVHQGVTQLSTHARLQGKAPLALGGFPSGDDRIIFVIQAR